MKDVQRYTITDYRVEMATLARSMPTNWTKKAIGFLPERHKESEATHQNRFRRVLRGMSYEMGVRGGYINAIRRVSAEHNNATYEELDPARVVSMEA